MSRVTQAEVICEVIRANWMLSNREIAKRANCTHRTIAKYRTEPEKSCEIGERLSAKRFPKRLNKQPRP